MHVSVDVKYWVRMAPGKKVQFWESWAIGKGGEMSLSDLASHLIVRLFDVAGQAGVPVVECNKQLGDLEAWLQKTRIEEASDAEVEEDQVS